MCVPEYALNMQARISTGRAGQQVRQQTSVVCVTVRVHVRVGWLHHPHPGGGGGGGVAPRESLSAGQTRLSYNLCGHVVVILLFCPFCGTYLE